MSDLGDQIFSKVSEGKDILTRIMSKVPGFSGYVERQERRASDKLLRDMIAARFEEQWGRISALQREFISAGEISYIDDLEAAAIKLRTFVDRVRNAARGYSGLFDAVKINQEELALLLEYDEALLNMSDEVSNAIDHVRASIGTDGLDAAVCNLEAVSQECIEAFNRRDEVVLAE